MTRRVVNLVVVLWGAAYCAEAGVVRIEATGDVVFNDLSGGPVERIGFDWLIRPEDLAEWEVLDTVEITNARQIAGFGIHNGLPHVVLMDPYLAGHADEDGDVDQAEYETCAGCMNGPQFDYVGSCDDADLDRDSDVDTLDVAILSANFGGSLCPHDWGFRSFGRSDCHEERWGDCSPLPRYWEGNFASPRD